MSGAEVWTYTESQHPKRSDSVTFCGCSGTSPEYPWGFGDVIPPGCYCCLVSLALVTVPLLRQRRQDLASLTCTIDWHHAQDSEDIDGETPERIKLSIIPAQSRTDLDREADLTDPERTATPSKLQDQT
ncbi:hypothetical protein STEG23_002267 [Scotinomys teguina]